MRQASSSSKTLLRVGRYNGRDLYLDENLGIDETRRADEVTRWTYGLARPKEEA